MLRVVTCAPEKEFFNLKCDHCLFWKTLPGSIVNLSFFFHLQYKIDHLYLLSRTLLRIQALDSKVADSFSKFIHSSGVSHFSGKPCCWWLQILLINKLGKIATLPCFIWLFTSGLYIVYYGLLSYSQSVYWYIHFMKSILTDHLQ